MILICYLCRLTLRFAQSPDWLVRIYCLLSLYVVEFAQCSGFVCLCSSCRIQNLLIVVYRIERVWDLGSYSSSIRMRQIRFVVNFALLALKFLNRDLVIEDVPEYWNRHSYACIWMHTRDSIEKILVQMYGTGQLSLWVRDLLVLNLSF